MFNKLLLSFVLLSFAISSWANSQGIYWQKLMLEEKIQRKISHSLNTVLADNQFLVDVETEVDEPTPPNFGDNKPPGLKVSDVNLEDSRGDYIAFSKVGLEVPVLDKYLDEDKTKLINLYRFNESYDVFKSLQSVKVSVSFSESLPAPLIEIAEKVVKSTRLSLGTIKPSFKFDKIALEWIDPAKKEIAQKKAEEEKKKPEIPQEPKIWKKDWLEWASRWGNAVGLILSALIIGLLSFMIFKKWKEYMENAKPKDPDQASAMEEDKNQTDEEKENEVLSEENDMNSANGFERFKVCLVQYPNEASNVSREWISANTEETRLALRAVAQQLSSDEFTSLLTTLGQEQRESWKSIIGAHLTPAELLQANKLVARDVLKALLVPSRVKDTDLLNLLMEIGADKTRQFLDANENHAGVIFNLMSPSVISSILAQVSDQKAEDWLTEAASMDMNKIEVAASALKQSLITFKQSLAPSHFNNRLMELILTSPPSRERMLFKSIAKTAGADELTRVAITLFPSELILKLPEAFLKETLQTYPMSKRIELMLTRSDIEKQRLLDAFAEAGTTAREMMDTEIESIAGDAGRLVGIQSRTDDIWKEFVQFSRKSLDKSPQYKQSAEGILKDWVKRLTTGLNLVEESAA